MESFLYNMTKIIKENNLELSNCRILDIGCGIGHQARSIAPFCKEYIGIDKNESVISKATELSTLYNNLHFYNYTLKHNKLDYKLRFNIIFHKNSFHFINDYMEQLDKVKSMLEDKGIAIFVLPFDVSKTRWSDNTLNKTSPDFIQEEYDKMASIIKKANEFLLSVKNIKYYIADNIYYFVLQTDL